MTTQNQNQPAQTPEQRIAQLEQYCKAVESINREIKAINSGLTDRCGGLAAERDGQANDANQLREHLQQMAQTLSGKDEQIKTLVSDLDNVKAATFDIANMTAVQVSASSPRVEAPVEVSAPMPMPLPAP